MIKNQPNHTLREYTSPGCDVVLIAQERSFLESTTDAFTIPDVIEDTFIWNVL
ncbi:MAG: hypothetical protein J5835_03295 [Bacteroidales bacterium]|nr:hypothetical protein [Bacteroidales bacterium]